MRSIYLGKKKREQSCPSCGGPKPVKLVGKTVGGRPLYHCKDKWHTQ